MFEQIEEWLSHEPNQNEVIVLRKLDNSFEVSLKYGNWTKITKSAATLEEAMLEAILRADVTPSAARRKQDKVKKTETSFDSLESLDSLFD